MIRGSTFAFAGLLVPLVAFGCGGSGKLSSGGPHPGLAVHRWADPVRGSVQGVSEDGQVITSVTGGGGALFVRGTDVTVLLAPPPWTSLSATGLSSDGMHWVGGISRWTGTDYPSMVAHYSPDSGLTTPEAPDVYASLMWSFEDDGTIYGRYRRAPGGEWRPFRWKSPAPLEPIEQLPQVTEFVPPQLTEEQANIFAPYRSRNHKWSGGHVVWKDAARPVSPVIVNAAGKQKLLDGVGTVSYVDDMGRVAVFRETRGTDDWGPWHLWIEGDKPRVLAELLVELGLTEAAEQEPEPQRLTGNGRHLVIQYRDQRLARLDIRWP